MPRTYDAKLSKTLPVNPETVHLCHVCQKSIKKSGYLICDECREAILFAKELKTTLTEMKAIRNEFLG